jgi:3'-5' exoribonuclease
VKALLLAFLDDPEIARGLPLAPAAKGIHHAYPGGLAEHLLSVIRLAHRAADHYPMLDRDLLVAGALLHDIGKVHELSYEKGTEYTDEGRLVGHLVMTAQRIHTYARGFHGFPPLLEQHITHLVLAHHGELAYGSPKEPATLEAYVVHALDTLDSRVASWLDLMARDPNERWTDRTKLYDRHLWKGAVPTIRNRSPVEPRRKRGRGPRAGHNATPERSSLPPEVTFKPLEALAPAAPASEATPPVPDQ